MILKSRKKIIVFYHSNCPDGFGACFAAWKKFKNAAEYIPIHPREFPNLSLKGKEIYILDNSFSKEIIAKLLTDNKKVVVIDHHQSSKEDVCFAPEHVFDESHSGAILSWKYFHPQKKVPLFFRYVEDVDLWRFKMSHTSAITKYAYSLPFSFSIWNRIISDIENPSLRREYKNRGMIIENYEKNAVNEIITRAEWVFFEGYKVFAVNLSFKRLTSQVGVALLEKSKPFSILWYEESGIVRVSLRSIKKFNVAHLAKKYGGGGHPNAAGFSFPLKITFPWKNFKK